jgi:transposase-like protein
MTDSNRSFNGDAKIKLTALVNEGIAVMSEIDTLQGGLNDTIKAIAEELEIKPGILKKAVRTAFKAQLTQTNKDNEELNSILEVAGKTL